MKNLILILVGLAAVGLAAPTIEIKEARIGYSPNIVQPQAMLGLEDGTFAFAKQIPGVAFKGVVFSGGPGVVEGLRAGVIDIGYSGAFPPLSAYLKAKDIVVLVGSTKGGTELMVAKNAGIKTVADLEGKTIGVNQIGSNVDVMVRYNLIKANLNPNNDVRIIEIAPAEQAEALKRGDVAAVAAPAPWSSVVAQAGGKPLLDWRKILDDGNYWAALAYTTKKFAEQNPNFIAKFIKANETITLNLNISRSKTDPLILEAWSKATKKTLNPTVAKAAFSTVRFTSKLNPRDFERLEDISLQTGVLRDKGNLNGFIWPLQR